MYEVTIPLRPVKDNEVGSAEDYFKIIREEYASRYLEMLNIASTPANKADFMRYRMMDDCDMMGIWPDLRKSALADAVRIVPPLRQRLGDLADLDEADRNKWRQWYGHADPILVRPPDVGASLGTVKLDAEEDDRNVGGMESGNGVAGSSGTSQEVVKSEAPPLQRIPGMRAELAEELEQFRIGGTEKFTEVGKGMRAANSRNDAERKERMREELMALKSKFILPFACERPAKVGSLSGPSRTSELVVWPMQGPLHIDAPEEMWPEVLQPIRISLEDVRKNTTKWVDEHMPLEYLTSRKDESLWEEVRSTLRDPDVARLIGLLAHLLHWVALMTLRTDGPQLSESALQSLFVAIHENWSQFEKLYRDSKTGVSFVLPCFMLTVKRGIERSFEISYPTLMSHEMLRQQVIDSINTLLMRLFDPDGTYARFGKFDGEGRAIILSKKLDAVMSSQGSHRVKRMQGRMNRATPLVRAVLGLAGTGECRGTVADTKTRVMMRQSDLGGTVSSGNVVEPPQDRDRQSALLKAAMNRLPCHSRRSVSLEGSPRQPASARPSQGTRQREAQIPSPQSARARAATTAVPTVSLHDSGARGRAATSAAPAASGTACMGAGAHSLGSVDDTPGTRTKRNPSPKVHEQTRLPSLPRPPRKGAT